MFCPKCGMEFPDSASFCPNCGQKRPQIPSDKGDSAKAAFPTSEPVSTVQPNQQEENSKAAVSQRRAGRRKSVLPIVLGLVVLIVVGVIVVETFFWRDETEVALSTVRNGYLGEYTDMTVEQVLDTYYENFYAESIWDSGVTDEGKIIVQVEYSDSALDTTTIQFSMLDEECFEITAFVSPTEDIEVTSDLLAALNKIYISSYEIQQTKNNSDVSIADVEADLMQRLSSVSGSAVLYGASKDYSGDRSQLCRLFGDAELDLSVPDLLAVYGIIEIGTENEGYQFPSSAGVNEELTDPNDVPNDLDACAVLNIEDGTYSTNYEWLESHLGQWVKLVGLYVDARMTDYNYDPAAYCLMYGLDEYGPGNYGEFKVTGPDNSMLIPLADGMSDTYYVFLDRDAYGSIIGINAFAEDMGNLASDPTSY